MQYPIDNPCSRNPRRHRHLLAIAVAALALAACGGGGEPGEGEGAAAAASAASDPTRASTAQSTADTTAAATDCSVPLVPVSIVASAAQEGNPATHLLDGRLDTRWSAPDKGAYVTVDLGAVRALCRIAIAWYNGGVGGRTYAFKLSVSQDNLSFTQLHSGNSRPDTTLQGQTVQASARYVRLTVDGNSVNDWASVTELQVSGPAARPVFQHPGILNSRERLEQVRGEIAQDANGWRAQELRRAVESRFGDGQRTRARLLDYNASPVVASMRCGQGAATAGDIGCIESREDALAAYTAALAWAFTHDQRYADKAIEILDRYADTLTGIQGRAPGVDNATVDNQKLQAAWLSELFPRAAEILRHTGSGWAPDKSLKFGRWLERVFLPLIKTPWSDPANWASSMANGTMNIGVYTDNADTFAQGVAAWRKIVPSAIYLKADGAQPIGYGVTSLPDILKDWWGMDAFQQDGEVVETCRDFGHVQMQLASIVQAAETASIQHVDLYAEQRQRIVAAHEFIAGFINRYGITPSGQRTPVTEPWMCRIVSQIKGKPADWDQTIVTSFQPTWEIARAHYASGQPTAMPESRKVIDAIRAHTSGREFRANNLQSSWEVLTHGSTLPSP